MTPRYSLAGDILPVLGDIIGLEGSASKSGGASDEPFTVPDTIPQGNRHSTVYKLLRSLKSRKCSLAVALAACHALNQEQCQPPINPKELDEYLRRVWTQPDSPDFNEQRTASLAGSPASDIVLKKASQVPDERLIKACGGRFVQGAIALVAGRGGEGKGFFAADVCARFTTGEPFPGDRTSRPPSNVLICVTEDSQGTVKSRLRAAGADLERVLFVDGPEVTRGGLTMPSPMMLDDDAGPLVRHAKAVGAGVLFLETVVEHFGDRKGRSRRSTNNESDVRNALAPFRAVCQLAGLFGFGVIHPRKSMEGSIEDSISGSAAFRNVGRAVHHISTDPNDETDDPVRLLFTSKANYLNRRPPTLRFRIVSWDASLGSRCMCDVNECNHEGRVVWDDDLVDERSAEDIWRELADRSKPRNDVAVQDAEEFLQRQMQDGLIKMLPKDIFALAAKEGINKAAIRRAKQKLCLVSVKEGAFPASVVGWKEGEM